MKTSRIFGIVFVFAILASIAAAWDGIPPSPLFLYGPGTVNATDIQIGDVVSVHEIDDGQEELAQVTVTNTGWFPSMSIPWDDPGTPGTDEGLTYSYPAKIGFQINGNWVQYTSSASASITSNLWNNGGSYGYITVDNSGIEGSPTQVDLKSIPNFAPAINANNQVVTQGNLLSFGLNVTDNNTYRNDSLSLSQSGSPGLSFSAISMNYNVKPAFGQATATWTPSCSDVCGSPYNAKVLTVTDDGRPVLSGSDTITITVTNINDAPVISDAERNTITNKWISLDLKSVLGYSDCDSCIGDSSTFTLISSASPVSGVSFVINDSSTGDSSFFSNVTGDFDFTINVSDTAGAWDTAVLTVKVTTVDVIVVKTIKAISLREYEITDAVYNVNNKSEDFTNLTLTDSDLGASYNFDLDYGDYVEYSGTATLSGDGLVDFNIAEVYHPDYGNTYFSNEPSIFIGGEGQACTGRDVERIILREMGPDCGDGNCEGLENCMNCEEDCGECEEDCVIVIEEVVQEVEPPEVSLPPREEVPKTKVPWGILVALAAAASIPAIIWALSKETLLVVSSRGLFRGPMVEETIRNLLKANNLHGKYNVKSVGTLAHPGHKPSEKIKSLAKSLGVDISEFQTKALSERDVKSAKHIIAMDKEHKDFLINHMLHKDKKKLAEKITVLGAGAPATAKASSLRKHYKDLKGSVEDKVKNLLGIDQKGEKANVKPKPKKKR